MLRSRIPAIAATLDARANTALRDSLNSVVRSAQNRAPVDTGKLRDAIHTERNPDGPGYYVIVGDHEAFYGHLVEFGTSQSPPRPFLVPALEENRVRIVGEVAASLKRL